MRQNRNWLIDLQNSNELFEKLKKEFEEAYKCKEMCSVFANNTNVMPRKEPPYSMYKLEHAPFAVQNSETEGIVTINFTSRTVKPSNLSRSYNLGADFFENPNNYVPNIMSEIAVDFVEREYSAICKGLESCSVIVTKSKKEGNLSIDDIWEAYNALSAKGANPDLIAMPIKQETQLVLENKITGFWQLQNSEKTKLYYAGRIATLIDVYWARFLQSFALITDRDDVLIQKTPLEFSFDSMDNPTQVVLKEWLACAPMFDEAVAKITF